MRVGLPLSAAGGGTSRPSGTCSGGRAGRALLCRQENAGNLIIPARAGGFLGFGFYREPRNDFIHIDLGPKREWGSRWPVLTPAFTPEPPAQKPLAQSRTMKGSGTAGVATVGAAGVEAFRDAAAETQAAVQPLIPWLDTLRWLFIAAALAGIVVVIYARWDHWRRGQR